MAKIPRFKMLNGENINDKYFTHENVKYGKT